MKSYPVPAETIRRESSVLNSRFIATLAPVFSVDEAKAFINGIRAEYYDATRRPDGAHRRHARGCGWRYVYLHWPAGQHC